MLIEDTFVIEAPIQKVWDFLFDIEQMSECVPGVERAIAMDDETYQGTLKVKIGPIAASFAGKAQLTEVDAPHHFVAKVESKDSRSASLITGTFTSTLTPLAENQTKVAYTVDVAVRGRLGRFGQGVMRDTAKHMTAEFVKCLQVHLQAEEDPQLEGNSHAAQPISLIAMIKNIVISGVKSLVYWLTNKRASW